MLKAIDLKQEYHYEVTERVIHGQISIDTVPEKQTVVGVFIRNEDCIEI